MFHRSLLLVLGVAACVSAPRDPLPADADATAIFDGFQAGLLPPPQPMQWSVPQVRRGQNLSIDITAGPANQTLVLAATANTTGAPACPAPIAPECMQIANPFVLLGQSRTNGSGEATFSLTVPANLGLDEVALQVVGVSGGVVYATEGVIRFVVDDGPEICNDGADNNGDGVYDCQDATCTSHPACGRMEPERNAAACTDGVDNDGDGFVDCDDFDCRFDPRFEYLCGTTENTQAECSDGIDNDASGSTDCSDFGCSPTWNPVVTACLVSEALVEAACSDNIDNDGNGAIDCVDPGCSPSLACGGPGFDEVTAGFCSDRVDNDADGLVDCADPGCASFCSTSPPVDTWDTAPPAPVAPGSLILSQIVDGPDPDLRFVEFTNIGTSVVDLSEYRVQVFSNGGTSPSQDERLTGSLLAPGDSWVIGRVNGFGLFTAVYGTEPDQYSGVASGNGNDAYALLRQGQIVDVFGTIGTVPGTWDYTDAAATRQAGATPVAVFDANEWLISTTLPNLGQHP